MKYFKFNVLKLNVVIVLLMTVTLSMAEEKGELPEVIIKGEEVLKLDSAKPKLEIPIEENSEILKTIETEEEILLKKPTGWEKQPKDALPEITKSPQVIIPRTHYIPAERVCIFHPFRDLQSIFKEPNPKMAKKSAAWKLVVVDDSGQTFREYSGKGLPPETIIFDGRDNAGTILEIGYPYSTVLRYYDAEGNLHTLVSNPFVVRGLAHQMAEGFFISLDFKSLYEFQPTVLEERTFSGFGKDLLREAAGWIKKNYFAFPVNVIVYSKNKAIAEVTAKEISEELAGMLLRLNEEITHEGKISAKSLEKVEIIIGNR